jgi:hypothetical protein
MDYVVLDAGNIAWRECGDHLDDGDWEIGCAEDFLTAVLDDAIAWLDKFMDVYAEEDWGWLDLEE